MGKSKKLYDENSIKSLSPLQFVRLRPGVYAGSTEYSTQLLIEVLSNAIDEYSIGHGNKILITIMKDNSVAVEDLGQGFLVNSLRDDGKTVLEASFSVLNTSGKYDDNGVYEGTALGLNGIGSKLPVFLSRWAEVISHRDGKFEHVWFEEGVFKKREVGDWNNKNNPSGTLVQWKPSEEFFKNIEVNIPELKKLLKVISCLCKGLRIELDNKGEKTIYEAKDGLNELVNENISGKELINNRLVIDYIQGKNKLNLVLTYTQDYKSTIIPYVNTGLTETGQHITQIKSTLTREMNKFFRSKGWLKDKDENLSGEDCQEGLYIVFNITTKGVSYDGQLKNRVVEIDMSPFIKVFAEELNDWMAANEKDLKKIVDKALNARKAREAAKAARDAVRTPKEKKEKLLNLPTKLIDCYSKDRARCELLVSEGDSAASGLVSARSGEFQAVFPIRGKIISSFKNTDAKIFANQEVVNIIKALGLDLDPQTKKLIYNKNKLRYGKIVLCADAK